MLCKMHNKLFKYSLNLQPDKNGDIRYAKGELRNSPVDVDNAGGKLIGVSPVETVVSDTYTWCDKAKDLIMEDGNLKSSEYIDQVATLCVELWKIQPFKDGNKRVMKGVMNYLLGFKNLPNIFSNNDNVTEDFIDSLINISYDDQKGKMEEHKIDFFNVIFHCIKNSYPYFYDKESLLQDPIKEMHGYRKPK